MAKQLIIIRHAKSDWGNSSLRDFDRPLNKRGKTNAPEMAQRLVDRQIRPDAIVSSPALRAITTAKLFAEAWGIPPESIQKEPSGYEASARTLLSIVNMFDNAHEQVAMFGHNPGLTDLVNYLGGHLDNLPTCGVVIIEFPFDEWQLVSFSTGKIVYYDYPKSGDD
jgi:phosphohistidine phosphatase